MSNIINKFKIDSLKDFPENSNPFVEDYFHLGITIGNNCCIMFENHKDEPTKYLIIVNTETGKRIKITLNA